MGDELRTISVWDGKPETDAADGTSDCVGHWAARGCRRIIIPPDGGATRYEVGCISREATFVLPVAQDLVVSEDGVAVNLREEIHAVLCGEWEPPPEAVRSGARAWLIGVGSFFLRAAAILGDFEGRIVHRWVDGARFRLIFDDLDAAARAALALRDQSEGSGRLRLGLHAGPIMRWPHPMLLAREEPAGIHLQKASRLADIPWCGRVRASREYVALLEGSPARPGARRLRCIYQGLAALGEPFDRQELFVVTA